MINNLIAGISMKLKQVFGDGVGVHSENINQELIKPCFFISVLKPSQTKGIGSRLLRHYPFDIHYFPAVQNNNNELQGMASDLYDALEDITLENGDLLRGSNMNHEVIDGVLHFYVNFNMHVSRIEVPSDPMETSVVNSNVKG